MEVSKPDQTKSLRKTGLRTEKKLIQKIIENKATQLIRVKNRSSNTKMNLIKTYAIIVVVSSHCNGGGIVFPMQNWISPLLYFMPIFVFVSGYFYKKENDDAAFFTFIKQRFMRLVVPYFLWNIFYGIINCFFRKLGIIKYGDPINFNSLFIRPWIDGHQFHFNIAAWFLLSLFLVVITTYILRRLMKLMHILNEELLLVITFIISIISIYFSENGYNTGWYLCLAKFCFLLPYYQLGFVYKKYEKILNKHKAVLISAMICSIYSLLVLSNGVAYLAVVFAKFGGNPLILTGLTVLGILMTATVCEILVPSFENSRLVKLIGDNTFSIMMHHPLIIFIINLALYIMSGFIEVTGFDVETFKSTIWYVNPWRDSRIYIFYVAFAVAIPLLIKLISDNIILKLYNRFLNGKKANV